MRDKNERASKAIGPPNLIPVLNLVTILIPFLLLTVHFVHLAVVDSSLPSIEPRRAERIEADPETLRLTVAITDRGFVVGGNAALLASGPDELQRPVDGGALAPTIPLADDGSHDLVALTELMVRIKAEFPDEDTVILLPEPEIPFDTIIATLDATRDHLPVGAEARELLFPSPVFAGGVLK